MRVYQYLDLTSFSNDSLWTTFFNSRAPDANVNSIRTASDLDKCCPRVIEVISSKRVMLNLKGYPYKWLIRQLGFRLLNHHIFQFDYEYIDPIKLNAEIQQKSSSSIQRISCTMSEKEFVEKYVRTLTPVLIQGCDFEWLNEVDLSLSSAVKVDMFL